MHKHLKKDMLQINVHNFFTLLVHSTIATLFLSKSRIINKLYLYKVTGENKMIQMDAMCNICKMISEPVKNACLHIAEPQTTWIYIPLGADPGEKRFHSESELLEMKEIF